MKSSKTSRVKQPVWRRKGIWSIILILLLAGGGAAAWYFLKGPGSVQANASLQTGQTFTSKVQRGDITISTTGSGTLVASETVNLAFTARGTVEELNVAVGDMVKAGDVLARQGDSETLQASVATYQYQLLQAQQNLEKLQQNAGLAVAEAYQKMVDAQAAYDDAAAAALRTAGHRCSKTVNTRYATILEQAKQKLNSMDPLAYGTDLYVTAKNDYETALANYNYCIAYTSSEKTTAQADADVAKYTLEQAQETYNSLKEASGVDPEELALAEKNVEQLQSQLEGAKEDLEGLTIIAPIDGKIMSIAAGKGMIVGTDTYITLADVSHPTINLSLDSTDIDKLVQGTKVTVTFDALTDETFEGEIVQVDPSLTSAGPYTVATGTVQLNDDSVKVVQTLPLGLNATVSIVSQEAKDVLVIPLSALRTMSATEYAVMVIGTDGQPEQQTVKIGLQNDNYVEISEGLQEGDTVVLGVSNGSSSTNEEGFPMPGGDMMPPSGGGMPGGMP